MVDEYGLRRLRLKIDIRWWPGAHWKSAYVCVESWSGNSRLGGR